MKSRLDLPSFYGRRPCGRGALAGRRPRFVLAEAPRWGLLRSIGFGRDPRLCQIPDHFDRRLTEPGWLWKKGLKEL